jgi:hypothetical protein
MADGPRPWFLARIAHGNRHTEIRVAGLQIGHLMAEYEIARSPEAENQMDLAGHLVSVR